MFAGDPVLVQRWLVGVDRCRDSIGVVVKIPFSHKGKCGRAPVRE
jgi:hypothetical protein